MTTGNFYFYLQNRLIQISQTGGQWYSDTYPLVFPVKTKDDRNVLFCLTLLPLTFAKLEHLFTFVFNLVNSVINKKRRH